MTRENTPAQPTPCVYLFDEQTHNAFLALCGDYNPIHADAGYCARIMTGKIIVHGMHIVLAAAEAWSTTHQEQPTRIKCKFILPISIGDEARLLEEKTGEHRWNIQVLVDDKTCATIMIAAGNVLPDKPKTGQSADILLIDNNPPAGDAGHLPLDLDPHEQCGKHFRLRVRNDAGSKLFPELNKRIGITATHAIATCSYFVGMVCPGLYSLCTALDITLDEKNRDQDALDFHVENFDDRFRIFNIHLDGAITGKLTACRRKED
ncbi:MAG TPA: MaoC family dehydratase [Pseudomonadales bacterium]|nr:MaoC family dehydratase [Pseudomonadales bacterium]